MVTQSIKRMTAQKLAGAFYRWAEAVEEIKEMREKVAKVLGRGLHSSTFQLNLSRFGHTFLCTPVYQTGGKSCDQRIPQNVLTLSQKVDESQPLVLGKILNRVLAGAFQSWYDVLQESKDHEVGRCRLTPD